MVSEAPTSKSGSIPDVAYALTLMGCWMRDGKWDGGPSGACRLASQALTYQQAEIERLRAALRSVYEVWAGSDGFVPQTAAEAYQQRLIHQMRDIVSAHLSAEKDQP